MILASGVHGQWRWHISTYPRMWALPVAIWVAKAGVNMELHFLCFVLGVWRPK